MRVEHPKCVFVCLDSTFGDRRTNRVRAFQCDWARVNSMNIGQHGAKVVRFILLPFFVLKKNRINYIIYNLQSCDERVHAAPRIRQTSSTRKE